jgi:hypothetical protein
MRSLFLVAVISLTCAGCGPSFRSLQMPVSVIRSYEIGQEDTVSVGEPIFSIRQTAQLPVFRTRYAYGLEGYNKEIPRQSVFIAVSEDAEGRYLLSNSEWDPYGRFVVTADGVLPFWIARGQSKPAPLTIQDRLFQRTDEVIDQPGAFGAELIYSGVAGGVLRAIYREYVDNFARPAYTQELQYDLSAERVISFRSVRISVADAANTRLRFTVVDDGGLPWLPAWRPPPLSPAPPATRP